MNQPPSISQQIQISFMIKRIKIKNKADLNMLNGKQSLVLAIKKNNKNIKVGEPIAIQFQNDFINLQNYKIIFCTTITKIFGYSLQIFTFRNSFLQKMGSCQLDLKKLIYQFEEIENSINYQFQLGENWKVESNIIIIEKENELRNIKSVEIIGKNKNKNKLLLSKQSVQSSSLKKKFILKSTHSDFLSPYRYLKQKQITRKSSKIKEPNMNIFMGSIQSKEKFHPQKKNQQISQLYSQNLVKSKSLKTFQQLFRDPILSIDLLNESDQKLIQKPSQIINPFKSDLVRKIEEIFIADEQEMNIQKVKLFSQISKLSTKSLQKTQAFSKARDYNFKIQSKKVNSQPNHSKQQINSRHQWSIKSIALCVILLISILLLYKNIRLPKKILKKPNRIFIEK